MAEELAFSVVVPTYNEAGDISMCLDAVFELDPPAEEVIVVDDASTDRTREIVSEYDVTLLVNDENRGVAATRNRGIEAASGDVVVLLNADVLLPTDFLGRVRPHYEAGADFVVCNSQVENTDDPAGCYVQAKKDYEVEGGQTYTWSEGWSARREILLAEGGFDETFPSASGEDAALADDLAQRYDWHSDWSIEVPHVVPADLSGFRSQRYGRGRGRFYYARVEEGVPLWKILGRGLFLGVLSLLLAFVVVPVFLAGVTYRGYQYYRIGGRFPLWMVALTLLDFVENRRGFYGSALRELLGHE
jgi:glycosyltransferase involved in cell wall biosynthesis